LRKITSLTVLLSFVALVFTSVFTYLAPRGRGSSEWEALGLGKHDWFALHTDLGILFLAAGIVHTILNIRPIISYLRDKQKNPKGFALNFNIALVLTIWVVAGSLLNLAPFKTIHDFKEGRNPRSGHPAEAIEQPGNPLPEKPPFLYGGRSLVNFCNKYDLQVDLMVQGLKSLGIDTRAEWSINKIAEKNDMEPRTVYDSIRQIQEQ
jgi:hypothetical protein